MSLTSLSVRRRIAVTMAYVAVILLGLVATQRMAIDFLPEIEAPVMSVITTWPGASAADVEEDVTELLEDNLGALSNLDEISSITQDNVSVIQLLFDYGTDLDSAANEVRDYLEFVAYQLPESADSPRVLRLRTSAFPIYLFGIVSSSGDILRYSDFIDDQIIDPLSRVPGVGNVVAFSSALKQVVVEVDPRALTARGLTLDQLSQALVASNLSLPAGFVDVGQSEYLVRLPADLETLYEIESLVIGRGQMGQPIRVSDVAEVHLKMRDIREVAEVDDDEAIWIMAQKQSDANTVEVVQRLRAELERLQGLIPGDLTIMEIMDGSEFIIANIDALSSALVMGGIFIVLVVLLFIQRIGPSLIISLSLPTCLILVLLLMFLFDYTLNGITLVSMALAIGMVVDNSIVVLENIIQHIERGEHPIRAALRAPPEVAPAVVASSMTSIAIFAPLIFIGGMIGIFFRPLAFVVISALVASLVTSLVLTPMLAGWWLKPGASADQLGGWRKAMMMPLTLLTRAYRWTLSFSLRHRWLTLMSALGIVVLTVSLFERISVDFASRMDSGDIEINVNLPLGTDYSVSAEVGRRIADVMQQQPEVMWTGMYAGESGEGWGIVFGGQEGSNYVQVTAKLVPPQERERSDYEVAHAVEQVIQTWPEIMAMNVQTGSPVGRMMTGQGGLPIVIRLAADRTEDLRQATAQVLAIAEGIDGIRNPTTNTFDAKPEIRLEIDREVASELLVAPAVAASTVRTALYGTEISRVNIGGHDYPLYVRLAEPFRDSISDIRQLEVPNLMGEAVPLMAFVDAVEGEALIQIRHQNKQRVSEITADFRDRPLGDIVADLDRELADAELPAGVSVEYGGQIEQQQEAFTDLSMVLGLAILLVFMVLAAQFESLVDPLAVMFAVPFAFTGTFLFLILTGQTLTIFAFLGLIILMGIVVNNAIVLVDFINLMRRRNPDDDLNQAICEAGRARLRPVLMTTFTTIAGMAPLAWSRGIGNEMWRPIGIAVIGGLLVSTFVTLVLVPTMYRLFEPFRRHKKKEELAAVLASEATGGE